MMCAVDDALEDWMLKRSVRTNDVLPQPWRATPCDAATPPAPLAIGEPPVLSWRPGRPNPPSSAPSSPTGPAWQRSGRIGSYLKLDSRGVEEAMQWNVAARSGRESWHDRLEGSAPPSRSHPARGCRRGELAGGRFVLAGLPGRRLGAGLGGDCEVVVGENGRLLTWLGGRLLLVDWDWNQERNFRNLIVK